MLAYAEWKLPTTTLPFLRVALCAAQVTAPKQLVKDGLSRMVNKADFDKLKQKKLLLEVEQVEKIMEAAWVAVEDSGLPMEKKAMAFGKFQVRLVLFLLGKQLKGREGIEYGSITEINKMFKDDLLLAGQTVSTSASAAGSAAPPEAVKSLADASDAKAIALAANKHIVLGKHYAVKNSTKVWTLFELTQDGANLVHKPFFESEEKMEVPHQEWKNLKEWTKAVPQLISKEVQASMVTSTLTTLAEETARLQAQCCLFAKCQEYLALLVSLFVKKKNYLKPKLAIDPMPLKPGWHKRKSW